MSWTRSWSVAVEKTVKVTCWPQWGWPSIELSRTRLRLELVFWTWPLPPPFPECAAKSMTDEVAGIAARRMLAASTAKNMRFIVFSLRGHPCPPQEVSLIAKCNGHDEELITKQ